MASFHHASQSRCCPLSNVTGRLTSEKRTAKRRGSSQYDHALGHSSSKALKKGWGRSVAFYRGPSTKRGSRADGIGHLLEIQRFRGILYISALPPTSPPSVSLELQTRPTDQVGCRARSWESLTGSGFESSRQDNYGGDSLEWAPFSILLTARSLPVL